MWLEVAPTPGCDKAGMRRGAIRWLLLVAANLLAWYAYVQPRHGAGGPTLRPPPPAAPAAAAASVATAGGRRWRQLEQLHAGWDLYVTNLDKRPDKLACVQEEFSRVGLQVKRIPGLDGTALDVGALDFINTQRQGRPGHRGCLYAHLEGLLHATGHGDCATPQYKRSSRPSQQKDAPPALPGQPKAFAVINVTNGSPLPVQLLWVDYEGRETLTAGRPYLHPGQTLVLPTYVGHVWRARAHQLSNDTRLLAEILVDTDALRSFVVLDCRAAGHANKPTIIFEDDVVFDADFVTRFLTASSALPEDWDILLLNWYCTTESPWGPWCQENVAGSVEVVPHSGLVPARAFMSGAALAVSAAGAAKILGSFPCYELPDSVMYGARHRFPKGPPSEATGKRPMMPSCSSAIDWHLSNLIEYGVLNAYGMMPEAVCESAYTTPLDR
jgi:GR25 family glycosyltransferase involved in LPS biosynthesis